MTLEELQDVCLQLSMPKFTAKQMAQWIYGKHVHTIDEMRLLVQRFPDRIRLFTATVGSEMVAGVVMFEVGPVAHAQYIAASERGRELKALTRLFDWLIDYYAQREFRYFDFGISTEQHGAVLNRGLVQQKCHLGGRGILYPIYEVPLSP